MKQRCYILATDLDGTLVGDEAALGRLNQLLAAIRSDLSLIYLTGRHLASARELIEACRLMTPDVVVTDVGTEIYWNPGYRPDQDWHEIVSSRWDADAVACALEGLANLQPQPINSKLRRSYWVKSSFVTTVEAVRHRLKQNGCEVRVIASSGRDIDVLPARAGKGAALRHVLLRLGQSENVVACGDSGNDIDLLQTAVNAVIVGNAQPELRNHPFPPGVYRAAGCCAAGILEGLAHFRWFSWR